MRRPSVFNYLDKEEMFDAVSYNKGGQILHMLRKAVGDEVFFAALKLYLNSHQFKSVEIHNLRLAFEEVSGQDMNWFFNQWFLAEGRPHLQVSVKQNVDGDLLVMTEQTQDLSKMRCTAYHFMWMSILTIKPPASSLRCKINATLLN
jgi:aminopeptidase N